MRDPRYDVLFEPVQIGPVTARNRFYQVPHCCGMGYRYPQSMAAMRGMKAEGGWAVVCTEELEIHHSSELAPYLEGRIWDDRDLPQHRLMTDAVHEHGALAGIELLHSGFHAPNLYSRVAPMAPSPIKAYGNYQVQARAMSKRDIADLRRWYVEAARRARAAGYDIVYVYAGHDLSLLQHFMKPLYNQRSDEYGGTFENRARFPLEVLDATREIWSDKPLSVRISATASSSSKAPSTQSVALSAMLKDHGVDLVDVSAGQTSIEAQPVYGRAFQTPFADRIRNEVDIATLAVGNISTYDDVNTIVLSGRADLVALARGMLFNPRWAWHAAMQLGEEAFYPPQYERAHPSMRQGDFLKPARDDASPRRASPGSDRSER